MYMDRLFYYTTEPHPETKRCYAISEQEWDPLQHHLKPQSHQYHLNSHLTSLFLGGTPRQSGRHTSWIFLPAGLTDDDQAPPLASWLQNRHTFAPYTVGSLRVQPSGSLSLAQQAKYRPALFQPADYHKSLHSNKE